MLYHAYELQRAWLTGVSAWASIGSELMANPRFPMGYMGLGPIPAGGVEVEHDTANRGEVEVVDRIARDRARRGRGERGRVPV